MDDQHDGRESMPNEVREAYERDIEPLVKQLQAALEENEMLGVMMLQYKLEGDPDGVKSYHGMFKFMQAVDKRIEQHGGDAHAMAKDIAHAFVNGDVDGLTIPAPIMLALMCVMDGDVDPMEVVVQAIENRKSSSVANRMIEELGLNEEQAQKLRSMAGIQAPPKKKSKSSAGYVEVVNDDGELIGFKDLATGEIDYWNQDEGTN